MKELIKKQEEEFDIIFPSQKGESGGLYITMYDTKQLKDFIAKVRKETAEAVCDKMIGKEGNEETPEWFRRARHGYNTRIEEEKEIKQQILKEIN